MHQVDEAVPLVDVLLHRWPEHFPTLSVARRVVARGRVWLAEGERAAEQPLRQAWWSEAAQGMHIVFLPDYPRRVPHEGELKVLYEDDHLAVVLKEPGLRLFGGQRTLANILAASSLASSEADALPAAVPVYSLEAEVAGCVLVAKTARAAWHFSQQAPRRTFRGLAAGHVDGNVVRRAPSVRFGEVLEIELDGASTAEVRPRFQAKLLGDQLAIRRKQLYLVVFGTTARRTLHREACGWVWTLCSSLWARLACYRLRVAMGSLRSDPPEARPAAFEGAKCSRNGTSSSRMTWSRMPRGARRS